MDPNTQSASGNGASVETPKRRAKAETERSTSANKELVIDVVCEQKSALLMDKYDETQMVRDLFRKERRVPRVDAPLEEIAVEKIYRNSKGNPVIPVECLLACLREAGRTIKVGKEKISYAEKSAVYSIFNEIKDPDERDEPEFIPLILPVGLQADCDQPAKGGDQKNDPKSPWIVDIRRCMMNNGGKKVATCNIRPRFNTWSFKLSVTADLSAVEGLTESHIRQLFERAGNRVGLLSWRPDCNGPMGRFKITKWDFVTG